MPKKPIMVGNVLYPSTTAFAKTRGVSCSAVCLARKRGNLETVGLLDRSCEYKGARYANYAEAARAHNITRQAVSLHFARVKKRCQRQSQSITKESSTPPDEH